MNTAIVLKIGVSILSIIKQIEATQATASGTDKKAIAMIFIQEAYNDAGLNITLGEFNTVAPQVNDFIDTAVAIYNALGKFIKVAKS